MKRPSLRSLLLILHCLLALKAAVFALGDSTIVNTNPYAKSGISDAQKSRTFEMLSTPPGNVSSDPILPDGNVVADSLLDKRAHAHALLQDVLAHQRFLESLDALSEIELPVGVVKSGGALDYSILIDRIQFTRDGALMDAYVSLALPQTNSRIAFHGVVPLSAKGGISGKARLFLLGDDLMKLNDHALITIKGDER